MIASRPAGLLLARCLPLLLFFAAEYPSPAAAGNYHVTPTSLDLRKGATSGTFTVVNKAAEKLDCKISVLSWSQEPDGKDVYAKAPEIVFFPKIMTLEPHDQRTIRVGVKGPSPTKEKAYRLFVEEIAQTGVSPVPGAVAETSLGKVALAYRWSIPIFWKPAREQGGGVLERLEMRRSVARAIVGNSGNTHLKLPSVTFRGQAANGKELFSNEINGWYILSGLTRTYEFVIPAQSCDALATIGVKVKGERGEFDGTLDVTKEMCVR
jgi:fimbrial chaperone protein